MSNRKLTRIPEIKKEWCKLLQNEGIITCKDVLSQNEVELMNILHSYNSALALLIIVGNTVAVQPYNALQLLKLQEFRFLPTFLPPLDRILHGGFHIGTITELSGPPGCGKTQFSMMMSAVTSLQSCKGETSHTVVYIDTENAFSALRLLEIIHHKINNFGGDGDKDVSKVASQVIIFPESTFLSLHERLKNLEEVIIRKKPKLIILDSIASLARKEFSHHTLINDRNKMIAKQASLLKYYAEKFNLSVLVTNQIANSAFSDLTVDEDTMAALGNTWSHAVNTRLSVNFIDEHVREIRTVKSPLVAPSKMFFRIDSEGVVPLE